MNNHRVLLPPPENLKPNRVPFRNKRCYDSINNSNNSKPVSLLSLKFDSNADAGALLHDSWKSSSRSFRPSHPKRQMRSKTERLVLTQFSETSTSINNSVDIQAEN